MAFAQRLGSAAAMVEKRLKALLTECGPKADERFAAAMRHAVLSGGKRFRPFLVIESAALFGLEPHQVIDAASAFECIHCYSLVHDDLPCMDDDDLRRGQPTLHKAYDEWTAILAGDALLTLAFEILARPATHEDTSVRSELALILAKAAGAKGMVLGQVLDLEAEKYTADSVPAIDDVQRIQALKTGALIACACEAGAVLGKAPAEERAALKRYGQQLGLAFQIADDLLDAEGDPETLGKKTRKDAALGKATLVSIMGIPKARHVLLKTEKNAIDELASFGPRADVLIEAAQFAARRAH